jgi:hypothetical protein
VTRYAIFVLLAAACAGTLGCALKAARTTSQAASSAPKPQPAATPPAEEEPISIAQTNVILPKPQPIQAEALASAPSETPRVPDPPLPTPKPRSTTPARTEPRQSAVAAAPQGPQPPPANPVPTRRRIRPVENAADVRRLQSEIGARQHHVQDILAKARARQLSDAEKSAADRIQAFLEQTEAALKDQDLHQAEALSNRALLLCQELTSAK